MMHRKRFGGYDMPVKFLAIAFSCFLLTAMPSATSAQTSALRRTKPVDHTRGNVRSVPAGTNATQSATQKKPFRPASQPRVPSSAPLRRVKPAPQLVNAVPKEKVEALSAVVIEVAGSVDWAVAGVSPLESKGWTPVHANDRLRSGSQIRTGLNSYVNLKFGETTVVAIRSATHASLDQIYRSATTETIRVGLGYGTVRGGSTEGKLRSDVVIESTVATLAKRGTEGWEMQVEPMTGRFRISLAEHGLVEAMSKMRSAQRTSRLVRPGEYATDTNIANMWIKQDIFDRNVKFYQTEAVTLSDADFTADNTRGYGVLAPGAGSTLADISGRVSSDFVLGQVAQNFPSGVLPNTTLLVPTGAVVRPEGHFGVGSSFKVMVPEAQKLVGTRKTRSIKRPGR